jgi:hypothetical protein
MVCPYCHQPVLATYYFCPNCGTKLAVAPLSTTPLSQAWIYFFSAILPMMGFIFITRWPGIKYYRSADQKTKAIGTAAFVVLIVSTLITIWLVYVWTEAAIQSSVNSINADFSANG